VVALDDFVASAKQQESTSAVCALCLSLLQTLVTNKCSLLIADKSTDRYTSEWSRVDMTVDFGRRYQFRKDGHAEAEKFDKRWLPLESSGVEEERTGGVGDLANVKTFLDTANEIL
jgi:hypothetical protein